MDHEPGPSSCRHGTTGRSVVSASSLGDFARLRPQAASRPEPPRACACAAHDPTSTFLELDEHRRPASPAEAPGSAQLGDFRRLFARLRNQTSAAETSSRYLEAQGISAKALESNTHDCCLGLETKRKLQTCYSHSCCNRHISPPSEGSLAAPKAVAPDAPEIARDDGSRQRSSSSANESSTDSCPELQFLSESAVESELITPSTTPATPRNCHAPPLDSTAKPSRTSRSSKKLHPGFGRVLSYRLVGTGPCITVFDKLRSRKQRGDSLAERLKPLYALDALRAERYPDVGVNGIHVFLDMSNINISFQRMIRARYSIDASARLSPLPSLDLQFLTDILVRRRRVVALHAGCSIAPGKPVPRYVQQLRERSYHVDLRERKRVDAESARLPRERSCAAASPATDRLSAGAGTARYVEDLVDETLQTRIAESVMEHFQEQGTLVLATGDARPAKYSDGFFTYAERALRMGWHVEVVSWRKSLSSHWTSADWTARWGDRFCVVELDGFIDDLLACLT